MAKLVNILAQDKLSGNDRVKVLKKAVKAPTVQDVKKIYDQVEPIADTDLTRNLVDAIEAIANARFPKAWAELNAA